MRTATRVLHSICVGGNGDTMKLPILDTSASKAFDEKDLVEHHLFDKANQEWEEGDVETAFKLFFIAANMGDTYAFNSVGYFLEHGIGVSKDRESALLWYKKAAKSGDSCAYSNIGLLYRELGNTRRAKYWLTRAIHEGDGDAALELAKIYLQGKRKVHSSLAMQYLQIASKSDSITQAGQENANLLLEQFPPVNP